MNKKHAFLFGATGLLYAHFLGRPTPMQYADYFYVFNVHDREEDSKPVLLVSSKYTGNKPCVGMWFGNRVYMNEWTETECVDFFTQSRDRFLAEVKKLELAGVPHTTGVAGLFDYDKVARVRDADPLEMELEQVHRALMRPWPLGMQAYDPKLQYAGAVFFNARVKRQWCTEQQYDALAKIAN